MQTPKIWTDNLNNNIITEEMLEHALFSVNKRAKNCRNQKRAYKNSSYIHGETNYENYLNKEQEYYNLKSQILSYLNPVCIHEECQGYEKCRIYDYEKHFNNQLVDAITSGRLSWTNCYYEHGYQFDDFFDTYDSSRQVWFFDALNFSKPIKKYYFYYKIGEHSFHDPIEDIDTISDINLPIYSIGRIITEGHDIDSLCSVQFVTKLISHLEHADIDCRCFDKKWILKEQKQEDIKSKESLINKKNGLILENRETAVEQWGVYLADVLSVPINLRSEFFNFLYTCGHCKNVKELKEMFYCDSTRILQNTECR